MSKALVFSIEEFSVFDGPGIRTTVFLKGCPLRCEWCHNPEGQSTENSILRSKNGCIDCGSCEKYMLRVGEKAYFTEKSIQSCPQNLLRPCATEYTANELCDRISKNIPILNASGGGVTFSGGEPTLNHTFLLECLEILNGRTHRAVQTSGYCEREIFEKIIKSTDHVLFDLKLINGELHKRYTGKSNEKILCNLEALVKSGKDLVIRTPLIPTVTDTRENLTDIARLLKKNGVNYIELLPYNKMAGAKYPLEGRKYAPSFNDTVPVNTGEEIFENYGITVKIM